MEDNRKAISSEYQPDATAKHELTNEDYYIENELVVFTAAYHLKRGTCCRSGCRHCPYENDKKTGK